MAPAPHGWADIEQAASQKKATGKTDAFGTHAPLRALKRPCEKSHMMQIWPKEEAPATAGTAQPPGKSRACMKNGILFDCSHYFDSEEGHHFSLKTARDCSWLKGFFVKPGVAYWRGLDLRDRKEASVNPVRNCSGSQLE